MKIKKIRNNLKSDNGATVTVMGMVMIMSVLLLGIFMIDISKNLYIKQVQLSSTQKAAQTAIKEQNAVGGLKITAVNRAIREYNTQRKGGLVGSKDTLAHRTKCQTRGNYPKIKVTFDTKRRLETGDAIQIDGQEIQQSFTSSNGSELYFSKLQEEMFNRLALEKSQYKVVNVEVIDVADNYMMAIFGLPCSELTTTASAISASAYDNDVQQ